MKWLKKPLVQFILVGVILFTAQQLWHKEDKEPPISRSEIRSIALQQLDGQEELKTDSVFVERYVRALIEREISVRYALSKEDYLENDKVKDALASLGKKSFMEGLDLSDPGKEQLSAFLVQNSMDSTTLETHYEEILNTWREQKQREEYRNFLDSLKTQWVVD